MSDRSLATRAENQLMTAARIAGLVVVLLTAGCAGLTPALPGDPPETVAMQGGTVALAPVASPAATTPEPRPTSSAQGTAVALKPEALPAAATPEPRPTSPAQRTAVALKPKALPAAPPETRSAAQPAVNAGSTAARIPAKVLAPATPAAPTEQLQKQENVAFAPAKPEALPPLDLASLTTRLKDTKAIGVFTKVALKNQVDDLLEQFREFYQGRLATTLAELRQPFELLLLKVLALLQDADPPLAGAIVASREAIWGILADPAKFKAV